MGVVMAGVEVVTTTFYGNNSFLSLGEYGLLETPVALIELGLE
jgi:hypothetical protein